MGKSIFAFIWRYSKREQIIVLLMTLASFPFLYLSLEVPKTIINEVLGGGSFPKPLFGFELGQITYLLALCTLFLLLVLTNGVFKMRINIYKGTIAERMLRRLRYQLITRILRFPHEHFRHVSQGDLIPMVTAEVEPLGGLMGDAVASPVFQGGQMLTIMLFLFVQNPLLGLVAVALIPLQAYLIPKLQLQVNLLHREKVKCIRSLSNKIGETVAGVEDIHINDFSAYTLADYSQRLGTILQIRLEVYRKKFFMKFINNMINQITPFFFYSVGGYLVITGDLTVGALVAALGAYKDLTSPWRELLAYYNQVQDSSIRYETIVEKFAPQDLKRGRERPPQIPRLAGEIEASNVSWQDRDGIRSLHNLNFTFSAGSSVAITGSDEVGRNCLAQLLVRTFDPTSGRLSVDGHDVESLPDAVFGARVAYVGPESYVFDATVGENVQLGLKRKPPELTAPTTEQQHYMQEAHAAGNSPHPLEVSWIDYTEAGYRDRDEFVAWWLRVMRAIGSEQLLFEQRLNGRIDVSRNSELAARLLEARYELAERLRAPEYRDLVHLFDAERYNPFASVAENILFGTATDERLAPHNLGTHPFMLRALDACGLRVEFEQLSLRVADAILEMFSGIAPGHPYFERFGFVDEALLPRLKLIRARGARDVGELGEDDRNLFLSLPYNLIPERHRLGLIDESLQQRLLQVRQWFAANLPSELQGAIARFDPHAYHPQLTLCDNAVFGRIAFSQASAEQTIRRVVIDKLDELGLRDEIVVLVEDVLTGPGGSLLPARARERITLTRALAKKPDILICNRALTSLAPGERGEIMTKLRDLLPSSTLIWIDREVPEGVRFDAVFEVDAGRIRPAGASAETPVSGEPEPALSDLQQELNTLAGAPIFAGLSPASLKLLALTAQRRDYAAGDVVYAAGDAAAGAYVVLEGELEVQGTIAGTDLVKPLKPGEITGDVAAISDAPHPLTVRASVPTTTLFIATGALQELIDNDVGVASRMLRNVSGRVASLVGTLQAA